MAKGYRIGDVHAPVEDTDVPRTLKILVIVMAAVLISTVTTLSIMLQSMGLLQKLLQI